MLRHILIFFFLLVSLVSFGQTQLKDEDSVKHHSKLAIEIAPVIQWNSAFDINTSYAGIEANAVFDKRFVAGMHGELLLGRFLKRVVFPNSYEFDNYKLGVYAGYNFNLHQKMFLRPQLRASFAKARWSELEEKRYFAEDNYLEMRPEVLMGYQLIKRLAIAGSVGYDLASGVDLLGTSNKDLTGFNLSLSVRVSVIKYD